MDDPNLTRKYLPVVEIGRGGMAEVFLAVARGQGGFNKLVVLKKARAELTGDPEFITMFLDEARLAARLSHHNIVQTYEVGEEDARHFIAMEYLEGQPLNRIRHVAAGDARLPLVLQLRILAEVLAGLDYAHALTDFDGTPLGVVHRGVPPHNIFVTYEGLVKLVDFGIAKAAWASLETRRGIIKGKVAYMPPEQATGRPVDRRADIFAVGVMLWEAVTGVRMWKGMPDIVVVAQLGQGEIPRIRDVKPSGVAPELERIVERALAVSPADRYPTAAALQVDIEGYLDGLSDKSSTRELARYMADRFREQRAKIKQVIEAQVSNPGWSGPKSMRTMASLASLSGSPDSGLSEPTKGEIAASGAASVRTPTPIRDVASPSAVASAETPTSTSTPSAPTHADVRSGDGESPAAASPNARETEPTPTIAAPPRSRVPVALGGVVILGLLAAGSYTLSSRFAPAPTLAPTLAAIPTVPVVAPVVAPKAACPEGMMLVPGGRFLMGSDEPGFDLWTPAHRVTLDTFCIDVYEVTAVDYEACSDAGKCPRPDPIPSYPKSAGTSDEQHQKNRAAYAELCNFGKPDRAKHPINCVSWALADTYCKGRKARLPTEAEWEFTARGSDGRKHPWGDDPGDQLHMNACGAECNGWELKHGIKKSQRMYEADDGYAGTAPVGSFPKGKASSGAHDLIGNVWEWTSDWFETYKPSDAVNPSGARAGDRKAIRGGGFNGGAKLWLDPAFRFHQLATASAPAIGFRCAMNL